jgi:flagellar M-ring protein FliF
MKVYARLDTTKKIITAGILLGVLATLVGIMMYSGSKEKVLLWNAELSPKDFGKITKKLDEWGYEYTTSGTNRIYVNKDQKEIITTRLAQENLIPADIPGWKLFDVEKWTTTQFEREIKYRRALQQALKKHIESLDSIEKAYVEIAITKPELYTEEDTPYTASVIVTPAPQIKKLPKKIIKGIQL